MSFLDEEASAIVDKLTNNPFAIDDQLWLYWLCKIELIPGTWFCEFYLECDSLEEEKKYTYSGHGDPSSAVKMAYAEIDKDWLEKGFVQGKLANDEMQKNYAINSKKNEYWFHYMENDQYWGYRFTERRLAKVKDGLWDSKEFWDDILERHDGKNMTPKQMKEKNFHIYEHCMGNMTAMIMKYIVENKLIK